MIMKLFLKIVLSISVFSAISILLISLDDTLFNKEGIHEKIYRLNEPSSIFYELEVVDIKDDYVALSILDGEVVILEKGEVKEINNPNKYGTVQITEVDGVNVKIETDLKRTKAYHLFIILAYLTFAAGISAFLSILLKLIIERISRSRERKNKED